MISFKTTKGVTYCVTVPTSGTVEASYYKNGTMQTVTLVEADEPGQYYFCAPCWTVECSSDDMEIATIIGGGSGVGGSGNTEGGFIPEKSTSI